jgi:hypothetical protein
MSAAHKERPNEFVVKEDDPAHFIATLFQELLNHDGFSGFKVEVRILKRRQKEIIVYCGKQYRFVVDSDQTA